MSDVRVKRSGGLSQQLDSLISISTGMGDAGRLGDFYLCTPRMERPGSNVCWGPFQRITVKKP